MLEGWAWWWPVGEGSGIPEWNRSDSSSFFILRQGLHKNHDATLFLMVFDEKKVVSGVSSRECFLDFWWWNLMNGSKFSSCCLYPHDITMVRLVAWFGSFSLSFDPRNYILTSLLFNLSSRYFRNTSSLSITGHDWRLSAAADPENESSNSKWMISSSSWRWWLSLWLSWEKDRILLVIMRDCSIFGSQVWPADSSLLIRQSVNFSLSSKTSFPLLHHHEPLILT